MFDCNTVPGTAGCRPYSALSCCLLLALPLALSACNPRQVTPPEVDTNLVTSAPVGNYNGEDETVYFLARAADGSYARFEAGFIKDGRLTLNPEDPPVELQQLWIDTLPTNAADLEYSDGTETAVAVHVTAILIGDTGLMITGRSGLEPASGSVPADLTGLTWTSAAFNASWYLPETPEHLAMNVNASYGNWVAYGASGASQSTTMDPAGFLFNASSFAPDGGLPHPFYPTLPDPANPETPGDEGPEDPGDENPGDPDTPGDGEPEDPDIPGEPDPVDPETPEPVEVKAVISAPAAALTGETVSFTAAGSTGAGELKYAWNFGDGIDAGRSTEAAPTYVFQFAGTFIVELTVTDETGATDAASAVITITDPVDDSSGFQVRGYIGLDAPVGTYAYDPDGFSEFLELGSITSSGWLTFNFDAVPSEYLQPVNMSYSGYCDDGEPCVIEVFPPGSVSNPNASMFAVPELIIDDLAGSSLLAFTREELLSGDAIPQDGDASGMYVYADEPVNIITTPEMSDHPSYEPIHLELNAGWNFVAMVFQVTDGDFELLVTNADPADFTWFVRTPPPPAGIEFETAQWIMKTGRTAIPGVMAYSAEGAYWRLDSFDLTWSSSNPEVAGVNEGVITAHSYGTATITAEYLGLTATTEVLVNSVQVENPPPLPVDVTAHHYAGADGHSQEVIIGRLDGNGLFTFADIIPDLTPITVTPVVNSDHADDKDASLAFVYELSTGDGGRIWIGDPLANHESGTDAVTGQLWYSDRAVNINYMGADEEDSYDLTLQQGWNLIRVAAQSVEPGDTPSSFHFTNVPMNGVLDWTYEEPTSLVNDGG